MIKPKTIETRLYQQMLFGAAVQENSLIILPTGLGKTIIVVMTAAFFLGNNPAKQIIMTAPTRPLIDQHFKTMQQTLNLDSESVVILSGQIPPEKRQKIWQTAKFIITTPQTLRNDIVTNFVDLRNVSFMCIDEAHRLVGNAAAVLATEQYRKINPKGRLIGITASPGNSDKMREIIKNLGATRVEYMDEDDPQVKPYVFNTANEVQKVQLPKDFHTIIDILTNIFTQMLEVLKELDIIKSNQTRRNPRSSLISLPSKIAEMREDLDDDVYFKALGAAGHALRISHAIELIETQGIPALREYFQKLKNEYSRTKKNSIRKFFNLPGMEEVTQSTEELYEQGIIHPKINVLINMATQQLSTDVTSRILIFSNYRTTTKLLSEAMNKINGVQSHWFVGQTSSKDDVGLRQRDQVDILDKFREGYYNVLISTSVGEEGLDVAQCDLVIFYDIVPSATRLIQRSGRTGRSREGRVVLLIAEGTRDETYFWVSRNKRRQMKENVEEVKTELLAQNQTSLNDFFSPSTAAPSSQQSKSTVNEQSATEASAAPQPFNSDDFLTKATEVTIYIDSREKGSELLRYLLNSDVKLEFTQLPVADYIVSERVGIERKTTADFSMTLKRGDLFEQLATLQQTFSKPVLLIEGTSLYETGLHPNAVRGALSAISIDMGITIMQTRDAEDTSNLLIYLAKREQLEKKKKPRIKKKLDGDSLAQEQLALISQLPKVNRVLAERLLAEFSTPQEIINQPIDSLRKIRGIGTVLAERINLLLTTPYDESQYE